MPAEQQPNRLFSSAFKWMNRRDGGKELRICREITVLAGCRMASAQLLPLAHQVADLPHEGLVLVDDRARRLVVLVKAGRAHDGLELFDRLLAVRDARLETVDALLPGIARFLVTARARLNALAFFVGDRRQLR